MCIRDRPRIWSYVWLAFLILVIVYSPFVPIYGGMFFFMWKFGVFNAAKAQHPDPQAAMLLVGVLAIFLLLIVVWAIYAVLMGLRYSLAVPACVVEGLTARKAMRRSIELSKGSRGRIFLLGLLILIIELGLEMCIRDSCPGPGSIPDQGGGHLSPAASIIHSMS